MLMLMILYLLDSLYSGGTPSWIKPLFVFGYLFLTLISVGLWVWFLLEISGSSDGGDPLCRKCGVAGSGGLANRTIAT